MSVKHVQSAKLRKGSAFILKAPRRLRRLRSLEEDYHRRPPVLVNSLPKSGTHLLLQVARALPNISYYGAFIAQRTSASTRLRSQPEINNLIDQIVPGEVVPAHLPFSSETATKILNWKALHLFISRDPEAAILSEVVYLSEMAPWNALHDRFQRCSNIEEKVRLAIEGDGSPEFPNAAQRFAPFLEWRKDPNVTCVTYEELMTPERRYNALLKIAQAYLRRNSSIEIDINKLILMINCAIKPQRSHTYRPKTQSTPRTMSSDNRKRLNAVFQ